MKQRAEYPAELERTQFSERLAAALVARGMPASATALQRAFNGQDPQLAISVHAARKWVMGESIPTQARLRALAAVLGVSATWLRFGEEAAVSKNRPLSAQEHMLMKHFLLLPASQQTHVLALVQSMSDLLGKRRHL
jgi:transcriptional regulator with XRE-family HTH domain